MYIWTSIKSFFIGSYGYQATQASPYIPHPVSNQPITSNNYNNYYKINEYDYNGYYNDNNRRKANYNSDYNYYNNNDNQGYYNYYNSQSRKRRPAYSGGNYRYNNNPGSRPRQPPPHSRLPPPLPPPPPPPPPTRNVNAFSDWLDSNYQDSAINPYQSSAGIRSYQYSPPNLDNNYDYNYGQNYYSSSPSTQSSPQYPRNSFTGSCYACQNCQQCSDKSYCQGCKKCKTLTCKKKPPVEEKYLDPIDTLVEEFGRKTKG